MDFVFGTLVNDTLKLADHRANRQGIQHQHVIEPVDPQPDTAVTVKAVVGADVTITHMALYYTTDGTLPEGSRGQAMNGTAVLFERQQIEWNSLVWGYISHWSAVIPAQVDQTRVRYIISGWSDAGAEIYADWPDTKAMVERAAQNFFNDAGYDLTEKPGDSTIATEFSYYVDTVTPPDWAQDAIIYQIFVDRFDPGKGRDWIQTTDLVQPCGGTLWGVRDRLDYLEELGINCIWLSPVWASPTAHGYDTADYDQVEPRLGGDEALRAVIEGAHARGMRVLLDMACNHISNQHLYFQDALNNPDSPCRDWFFFDDSALGYKAFFAVPTMPEVNLSNEYARHWMISIAEKYLRDFDVDGFRLDYANGAGPTFWSYFSVACKQIKPDCLLFGEIIDAPDKLLAYAGRLDGCLNFQANDAIRRTFAWGTWTREQLDLFMEQHQRYFPPTFVLPTFLDNHDMERIGFITQNDAEKVKQAARYQMSLPKPAIIYYGTEIGLQQQQSTRDGGLDVNRVVMRWEDVPDNDLLAFYKTLLRTQA